MTWRKDKVALFKKRSPTVVPVATHLDIDWFIAWTNEILTATGIAGSEAELAGIMTRAMNLLVIAASRMMEKEDAPWAIEQMRAFAERDDATPWDLCSFVAGWDERAVDNLEYNLDAFKPKMIEAGQAVGTFVA